MSDLPASWACTFGVRINPRSIKLRGKTGVDCKAPAKNKLSPRGIPKASDKW